MHTNLVKFVGRFQFFKIAYLTQYFICCSLKNKYKSQTDINLDEANLVFF